MDEWFASFGAYFEAFDSPAFALSMALDGPPADHAGYNLAFRMIRAPEEIELYPPDEPVFGAI